jgi:hypothetical protein
VSPEVIAGDSALSFERLPARYAARQEPDQGPLLRQYLARQGTTAEAIIMELLASINVRRVMRDAGLSDAQIDRLRGRLLDAS